ncbi:MAG: hypothetical protein ABI592_02970 [Acidobacteriota bacterium]
MGNPGPAASREATVGGVAPTPEDPSPRGGGATAISSPRGGRSRGTRRAIVRGLTILGLAAVAFAPGACRSDSRLASRILEDYRRSSHARPLPASQVIRIALSAPGSPASGSQQVEWDGHSYRETFASAGFTTIRGIQSGKAYFIDEDGVTRVVSEPVLAELTTRSFFWRRAYLFEDLERAKLELGPADERRVSLRVTPRNGNPLLLSFTRRDLRLVAARSAGLDIAFTTDSRWRDASRRGSPVDAELRHTGLPANTLMDAAVRAWNGVFTHPVEETDFRKLPAEGVAVAARLGERAVILAIDAEADGPVRVRPAVAETLGVSFVPDVFGRRLARGPALSIAGWTDPGAALEVSEAIPEGADAAVGGVLFRETVVEYDEDHGRLRLHPPDKWVRPEGYYRCVLDDDGNRPMAIVHHAKETLRLLAGVTAPASVALAPESAERAGIPPESRSAEGLRWGPISLPALDLTRREEAFDPARGDDGRLSSRFLRRFRAILDLPHRWAYLRPETAPPGFGTTFANPPRREDAHAEARGGLSGGRGRIGAGRLRRAFKHDGLPLRRLRLSHPLPDSPDPGPPRHP